ncbi:DNA-directed RNA polymerase subunit beta' [Amylibacter marinus]|uniref:DNA-directed RNA polymerase subunit beta n=1 Tax=Amylibacter marinus TaxID=1475483 RepID=A0ABQ5VWM1_9RHOB|nr:glycosyltransferase [Amylibacter marinus]GLQ35836.1 DNA-directed RNA polymerase subunit beta' [Amylibacter marinus]
MKQVQALGIIRFSYVALGGFQVEHASVEQRLEYLFQPARIEERFALFEHVTLRSLRAQSDPNFTIVLLISADMPDVYLERLMQLVDGIPQIAIAARSPEDHIWAVKHAMAPYIDPAADAVAQFRLDDDDAVALDFIARAKAGFARCATQFDEHQMCGLDFNQGFFLDSAQDHLRIRRCVQNLATAGLVIYLPPDAKTSVLNYVHHRLAEYMPFETDDTKHMFVRSVNAFNDCRWTRNKTGKFKPAKRDLSDVLQRRFHIDLHALNGALGFAPRPHGFGQND